MKRLAIAVACAVAVAAARPLGTAQKPLTRVTFLTNYVFQGRHAPFFLGRDKGFYREAGFDLNIVPATGSGFVISAIDGGKAEYGMAESASVVQAVARGATVKGFSVFMDVSTSGLASLKPFPTPQSVAGRTIAASLTDSARVILPVVFARAGLDRGARGIGLDPAEIEHFPGAQGRLGAFESFGAAAEGDGVSVDDVALRQGGRARAGARVRERQRGLLGQEAADAGFGGAAEEKGARGHGLGRIARARGLFSERWPWPGRKAVRRLGGHLVTRGDAG